MGPGGMVRRVRAGGRWWVLVLTALMAVSGLGISLALGRLLALDGQRSTEREFSSRTDLVSAAVTQQAGRYVDTLHNVAEATGAFVTLTGSKYAQVTRPLANARLAGATSISFLVPATDAQIPQVRSYWRARGASGLVLSPVGSGQEHIFNIYVTPLASAGTLVRAGTDATQAPASNESLSQARRTGQLTVSRAYQFVSERNLPASQRQMSFVLTSPVYGVADALGHRAFRGWVVMAMHGQDFMGATLRTISQNQLDVALNARNVDDASVVVAALQGRASGAPDLQRTVPVSVANQQWQLTFRASAANLPGGSGALPLAIGAGGSVLALLLAAFVYVLATDRNRAQGKVKAATADLFEQKNLLEAIMNGLSEGIVVVDGHGEFILTNRAAAPYLSVDGHDLTDSRWDEHSAMFRADGVTPFPAAEMPTVLALSGQSSRNVEMVARRTGAEEIWFSVSADPLDRRAGRPGAVGVFHDITARKHAEEAIDRTTAQLSMELALRAQTEKRLLAREAELTAFSGMVAHDLKAPLRAVGGFTEILRLDLEEALPGGLDAASRKTMDKIVAAAARMGSLIDDLLSFATARDRTLHPQPVDLQVLITEVIGERLTPLKAQTPAAELPVIEVGPLPDVFADPSMCRQLLDNLIGNALKYTQPGQPAHIRIEAKPEPEPWARIEVSDQGIGIPPGQHRQLFTSFHRAHTGYPGTGLGLAICERIIERHGGTIGASDNPGGGSRFYFTLRTRPDEQLET